VINFSQLPEWFNRNLWVKQVMQSGLKGKYVMVISEEGWITKIKSLDIDLPVDLSIDFRRVFKRDYVQTQEFEGSIGSLGLAKIIWTGHYEAISNRDNLHHLYHYYQSALSDWYDVYYDPNRFTIYHDNDAIARQTMSADKDQRVVIFEINPLPGWSISIPRWDPTSWGSLSVLFGGETHD
jgi:hypothetical protein